MNAAFDLLADGRSLSEAADAMAGQHGISRRQAYRYLKEAARLKQPVPITEATVAVTLKLPPSTVRLLRAYAKGSGLTIGTIVTRALDAFLSALKRHG